jgi:hypothetical protein
MYPQIQTKLCVFAVFDDCPTEKLENLEPRKKPKDTEAIDREMVTLPFFPKEKIPVL